MSNDANKYHIGRVSCIAAVPRGMLNLAGPADLLARCPTTLTSLLREPHAPRQRPRLPSLTPSQHVVDLPPLFSKLCDCLNRRWPPLPVCFVRRAHPFPLPASPPSTRPSAAGAAVLAAGAAPLLGLAGAGPASASVGGAYNTATVQVEDLGLLQKQGQLQEFRLRAEKAIKVGGWDGERGLGRHGVSVVPRGGRAGTQGVCQHGLPMGDDAVVKAEGAWRRRAGAAGWGGGTGKGQEIYMGQRPNVGTYGMAGGSW